MQVPLALLAASLIAGPPTAESSLPPAQNQAAMAVQSVAGRNLKEWAADLKSPNEFIRLRAAKSLLPFGKSAVPALCEALGDKHVGVQYWAASHLGSIGVASPSATRTLMQMESGKNPALAMAAAFALCRLEKSDKHLKVLVARLEYPQRGMACAAAEFLGKVGPPAKSAVPALVATHTRHNKKKGPGVDYHVRGACQNALRLILGEWEPK